MEVFKALRFLTINVWYTAWGPTFAARLRGLPAWIAALQPGVLALQWVLRDASLSACSVTHLPQSAAPPHSSPVSTAPRTVTSRESCLARDGARLYDQCDELLDGLGFHSVAYGAASPF